MKIKYADFIKSAIQESDYPSHHLPEIAFIGRSNVGKSSLINMLTDNKSLAKVSATPGKTALINFFSINDEFCFVDLPGYGYAKRSHSEIKEWSTMIETYLEKRMNLILFYLLLDVRRIPNESDTQILNWLRFYKKNYAIILTKTDKLNQKEKNQQIKLISQLKEVEEHELLLSSTLNRTGRTEILNHIESIIYPETESELETETEENEEPNN